MFDITLNSLLHILIEDTSFDKRLKVKHLEKGKELIIALPVHEPTNSAEHVCIYSNEKLKVLGISTTWLSKLLDEKINAFAK